MKFGDNIHHLRKKANMNQEELAEKMGVSRQSVSKWENGENYPEMEKIMRLCAIFHCKINDLVHENMSDLDLLDEDIKMSVVKFKEEKQKKMKGISKAIYVLARIGKIFSIIAIPFVLLLLIVTPLILNKVELEDGKIVLEGKEINNFSITEENAEDGIALKVKVKDAIAFDETNQDSILKMKSILENNSKGKIIAYVELGFLSLMICLVLYVMVLNRLEKLFMNINKGDTPFTLENVHYIKEMAKLLIVALVLPNFGGIIFEKILATDLEVGFELFDVIQILFLFGIGYIFEYGYELQLDSKGKMYGDHDE